MNEQLDLLIYASSHEPAFVRTTGADGAEHVHVLTLPIHDDAEPEIRPYDPMQHGGYLRTNSLDNAFATNALAHSALGERIGYRQAEEPLEQAEQLAAFWSPFGLATPDDVAELIRYEQTLRYREMFRPMPEHTEEQRLESIMRLLRDYGERGETFKDGNAEFAQEVLEYAPTKFIIRWYEVLEPYMDEAA